MSALILKFKGSKKRIIPNDEGFDFLVCGQCHSNVLQILYNKDGKELKRCAKCFEEVGKGDD